MALPSGGPVCHGQVIMVRRQVIVVRRNVTMYHGKVM